MFDLLDASWRPAERILGNLWKEVSEDGGVAKASKDEVTAALKEHWTKRQADSLFYRLYPQSASGTSEEDMDRWCRRVAARLAGEEEADGDEPVSDAVMSGAIAGMAMAEKQKEEEKQALTQTLLDLLPGGPPQAPAAAPLAAASAAAAAPPAAAAATPSAASASRPPPPGRSGDGPAAAAAEAAGQDLAKLSVRELKQRISATGAKLPPGLSEKSELVEFLRSALASAGAAPPPAEFGELGVEPWPFARPRNSGLPAKQSEGRAGLRAPDKAISGTPLASLAKGTEVASPPQRALDSEDLSRGLQQGRCQDELWPRGAAAAATWASRNCPEQRLRGAPSGPEGVALAAPRRGAAVGAPEAGAQLTGAPPPGATAGDSDSDSESSSSDAGGHPLRIRRFVDKLLRPEQDQAVCSGITNPFVNPNERWTCYEVAKLVLLGPTLLPIRIILLVLLVLLGGVVAMVATCGFPVQREAGCVFHAEPLPRWRRILLQPLMGINFLMLLCFGFCSVQVDDHRKEGDIKPGIIVVSPHLTDIDILCGLSCSFTFSAASPRWGT
ncbi:unnamed protein product [Prorocentrum cordatum]|uniref:Acyltransferase n=1 Tax=Prorocentrum cordatum TaxID=2364126 RepID=A0ABN9RV55_9DINO|nr:unnamed protein product [Polarella glacialis]